MAFTITLHCMSVRRHLSRYTHLCVAGFPSCAPLIFIVSRAVLLFLALVALYPVFHAAFLLLFLLFSL
jgi:hypothetical protein